MDREQLEENRLKYAGIAAAILVVGFAVFGLSTTPDTDQTQKNPGQTDDPPGDVLLPEPSSGTTVYFFWGDGCPYCAQEKPFLEELDQKHDDLEVKMYEVYNSRKNQRIYQNVADRYGVSARGVPATFIGKEHWTGYNQRIGQEIENKVEECLENSCKGPLEN